MSEHPLRANAATQSVRHGIMDSLVFDICVTIVSIVSVDGGNPQETSGG